jgi:hypothetical protein
MDMTDAALAAAGIALAAIAMAATTLAAIMRTGKARQNGRKR